MWWSDEAGKQGKYRCRGDVEGFGAPERLRRRVGVLLLALVRRDKRHDGAHEALGGSVVAEVGQEVVVELPKNVQRDAAVRRGDVVIGLAQQRLEIGEDQVLGQQTVRQSIGVQDGLQFHDARQVAGLEARDGHVERLLHSRVNALTHQPVEIDAAAEQLQMPLLQQRLVAIGGWPDDLGTACFAFDAEALIQVDRRGQPFVVGEDLVRQLVNKLIEAQIDFRLHLKR